MLRRPPIATRTDTLFPYTTLFRSAWTFKIGLIGDVGAGLSPYVSYSEAFQPIPGFDRNGVALVPTRGRQIEGGVKWQPRHGVLITANYYDRSEEHTSELQSLMRISYAVFCLKKKKTEIQIPIET